MARFLLVNQYYWPDVASTGQHLTDLAESLARAGHDVDVVCSRGRYFEGRGQEPVSEERNGVGIRRVRATSFGKRRELGRLVDYLTFHLFALRHLLFGRRADVIVTLTTPPLLGVLGALVQLVRRSRHVVWEMDLHPDAEFAAGMLSRSSLLGGVLEGVSRWHLRRADKIVVLGNGQRRLVLEKGVDQERITLIPVWSDDEEIKPLPHARNPLRARQGWSERFVVMYSGNAGLAHTFDAVIDAADELATTDPDVLFAFIGGGPRTKEIRAAVESRGLENVEFLDYFPREEIGLSIPAGDAHLVTLRPEFFGIAVPGKLYGILAAGRPVLFVGPEDASSACTVRDAEAGFAFEPDDVRGLADAIRTLRSEPDRAQELGTSGREYFLKVHERDTCCEAWRALLEEVAGVSSSSGTVIRDPRLTGEGRTLRKTGS